VVHIGIRFLRFPVCQNRGIRSPATIYPPSQTPMARGGRADTRGRWQTQWGAPGNNGEGRFQAQILQNYQANARYF
jgi:hypothetical protein